MMLAAIWDAVVVREWCDGVVALMVAEVVRIWIAEYKNFM